MNGFNRAKRFNRHYNLKRHYLTAALIMETLALFMRWDYCGIVFRRSRLLAYYNAFDKRRDWRYE